jgi:hypothetical protein
MAFPLSILSHRRPPPAYKDRSKKLVKRKATRLHYCISSSLSIAVAPPVSLRIMSPAQLPHEIVDYVLSFCQCVDVGSKLGPYAFTWRASLGVPDDESAWFAKAALVCKSWVEPAQRYLYSTIYLGTSDRNAIHAVSLDLLRRIGHRGPPSCRRSRRAASRGPFCNSRAEPFFVFHQRRRASNHHTRGSHLAIQPALSPRYSPMPFTSQSRRALSLDSPVG